MSLVFLAADFPPSRGGIQTVAHELPLAIHRSGEAVGVVTVCREGGTEFDESCPYPVVRVPDGPKMQVAANLSAGVSGLIDQIPERPRAIIAIKWFPEGLAAINTIKINRPKIVLIGHGREFLLTGGNPLKWLAQKYILRQIDVCVAVSHWTAEQFVRAGVPSKRVRVVNNGVRPEPFMEPHDLAPLRESLGIGDRPVLVTVGRLVERKGHADVIRLLPSIIEQAGPVAYLIVGTGPEEKSLRDLATGLGLTDSVIFAGDVPGEDLPAYYQLSDVFIMPTKEVRGDPLEGFGVVYLEANAAGKPVIATRCGGVTDAVRDGVSGLLVKPGDDDALVAAAARLLTDREYAAELGRQGQERVRHDFNWDRVARRFLEVLSEGG